MKISKEQKEILYEIFELGRRFQKRYGHSENIEDWIEENEDKILALGKPEPLAKNKQTQEQKFYPCAVELLSDGTEHCTVECLDKKNCEFLRADATSR